MVLCVPCVLLHCSTPGHAGGWRGYEYLPAYEVRVPGRLIVMPILTEVDYYTPLTHQSSSIIIITCVSGLDQSLLADSVSGLVVPRVERAAQRRQHQL